MKKTVLTLVVLNSILASSAVLADNQTISLGYTQGKLQGLKKDMEGINLQYRYEWDSPVSIISSLTYMDGRQSTIFYEKSEFGTSDSYQRKDSKYYSLLAGPAYRLNNYFSIYGIAGIAQTRSSLKKKSEFEGLILGTNAHYYKSTSFAYGAGILINPLKNLSINIGYEGTSARLDNHAHSVDGFSVGAGYRF